MFIWRGRKQCRASEEEEEDLGKGDSGAVAFVHFGGL